METPAAGYGLAWRWSQPARRVAPHCIVNPANDQSFRAAVARAIAAGVGSPSELEGRLRPIAPAVRVHVRDLSGEQVAIWYVYRDGHWVRSMDR